MVLNQNKSTVVLSCVIGGVIYGTIMGLYSYLFGARQLGLGLGIGGGVLFGGIILVVFLWRNHKNEVNASAMRAQIERKRKVLCEGPATLRQTKGWNAIGGWLFLSEDAVEFYKGKQNFGGSNVAILLDDMVSVSEKTSARKSTLTITTKDGVYTFLVFKGNIWKEQIDLAVVS